MTDSSWFWSENGKQCGPVPEPELGDQLRSGRLPPDTPVWTTGLAAWVPAKSVDGFVPYLTPTAVPPVPPSITPSQVRGVVRYAGFWRRLVALLIDYALLLVLLVIFSVATVILVMLSGGKMNEDVGGGIGQVIGVLLFWLYYALFESSARQATPGKLALGISVVRPNGERLSFGRATGRHFAKMLSSLILGVGYLMAGWTTKKQALHDLVADCLVIRK